MTGSCTISDVCTKLVSGVEEGGVTTSVTVMKYVPLDVAMGAGAVKYPPHELAIRQISRSDVPANARRRLADGMQASRQRMPKAANRTAFACALPDAEPGSFAARAVTEAAVVLMVMETGLACVSRGMFPGELHVMPNAEGNAFVIVAVPGMTAVTLVQRNVTCSVVSVVAVELTVTGGADEPALIGGAAVAVSNRWLVPFRPSVFVAVSVMV